MPTPARARRGGTALLGAFALATVAACSSAPAPSALQQNGSTGGSDAAGTTGAAPPTTGGPAVAGTTGGAVTAPGVTSVTRPDGTVVTTTTKNGKTVTTVTKDGKTTTVANGPSATKPGTTTRTTTTTNTNPGGSALFKPDEERIGLTDTSLKLCAHAALTYGQAFGTKESDFNVFWEALNKEKGGINGRQVEVSYENDNYKPTEAVDAATKCKAKGIFMLLGGIGFDQIPAVRNWAETNRMLYVHHTATINGTAGQRFSFSELPTVERTGQAFAQLALKKYKGKRIGIIERDSSNWTPGVAAFKAFAKANGLNIVADKQVANNAGSYANELLAMKNANADVVWGWMNALEATQLLKQAKGQAYNPNWLLFPFNLTSQTLDNDALTPPLDGVAMYPAYSKGDYTGGFSRYADDVKEFERQYKQYDPDLDLGGIGGDLLFLNWVAQKALAVQLQQCGRDCTRDKFIDVLQGYRGQIPSSSACPIDFSVGDRHHGSDSLNFMETYKSPSGKVNWRTTELCVRTP
ncbi:MAG: ABC transporter substrate-binding protein [Actinobacteria bacterium]|nr:ABC transporter substrate-binding protein [Actinomycetota bacterium]MCA1720702.1 ABC transporter substrate-binding protein [Actinomycetota bacterium]